MQWRRLRSTGPAFRIAACLILLGVSLLNGNATPAKAVSNVTVTLQIHDVWEIKCDDNDILDIDDTCGNDYYAKVFYPGGDKTTTRAPDDVKEHHPTDWKAEFTVDRDAGPFPVRIQLWDHDSTSGDDQVDTDLDGDMNLDITVDPLTLNFTGNVPNASIGYAAGNFKDSAAIFFTLHFGTNPDMDADGIPDGLEISAIVDRNGTIIANLRSFGDGGTPNQAADPCKKTILMEIDWMQGAGDGHNHRPKDAALTEIQTAFNNAPVPAIGGTFCPYLQFTTPPFGSKSGVQLLMERSSTLPEQAVFTLADLDTTSKNATNFNPLRRPYFHYVVFGHDQAANSDSSGRCCNQGKDFIVTLGSWRTTCIDPGPNGALNTSTSGDDVVAGNEIDSGPNRTCNSTASGDDIQVIGAGGGAADYAVGTVRDQSGTLMHELGHALGLAHGGRDDINHRPNYLSNMNYFFQFGIPFATTPGSALDYSGKALPTLNEASLDEANALDPASTYNTFWIDPTRTRQISRVSQPIDWNRTAGVTPVDVNRDADCVGPGPNGTINTTPAGDDAVANGILHNGPNDTCETAPSGDDVRVMTGMGSTPLNSACLGGGANEKRDTPKAGDDVEFADEVQSGPNVICNTAAAQDDIQEVPVGRSEPSTHGGWDDWSNLRYRGALSPSAAGQGRGHVGDLGFRDVLQLEIRTGQLLTPDIKATKDIDKADAGPGDTLNYTVKAENIGTGDATEVTIDDTLPNGTVVKRGPVAKLYAGATHAESITYLIPCGTPDLTKVVNNVAMTAKNMQAQPEPNTSNNSASATTTVRAPNVTLTKSATATVNAGEAITYRLTYANTGSGAAANVLITETLPAGIYYSLALDLGAGPKPSSVTVNPDGTRTLSWTIGAVPANAAPTTIELTARPTLLALGGTQYVNNAALDFSDANGCKYPTVKASAQTTITVAPATANPLSQGYWSTHQAEWTSEILARIQATDQRFDGTDGSAADGKLVNAEVTAAFIASGAVDKALKQQLVGTYFNLATRRINADTRLDQKPKLVAELGLTNVRDAVLYAQETLALPPNPANQSRYSNATTVLDQINQNKIEVY